MRYSSRFKPLARTLRNEMTETERMLWGLLRKKQVEGVSFYRKKPLLNFIVDFYAPKVKLVIEVDGAQHFEDEHLVKDAVRDNELSKYGIKVLRFDNRQIVAETDTVLDVIYREVQARRTG